MIRRLFASFIIRENDTNPQEFQKYAGGIGTSVQMLKSNYVQVPENKDKEEYQKVRDLSSDEEEDKKPKKCQPTCTTTKSNKKAKK